MELKTKHTITEKQLVFLQDYIKRKKRFSDQEDLYELVDHLVNDFEATGNGNLSQYLADNSEFIFNYQTNKSNDVHWSYQRQLWRMFLGFFTRIKFIPITFLTLVTMYFLFYGVELINKSLMRIFFILIGIILFYGLIKTCHKNKKIRKLVSFKYLGNILAPTQFFLYILPVIEDALDNNRAFLFIEAILKKHKHLLN